jgi:hypothetical protein
LRQRRSDREARGLLFFYRTDKTGDETGYSSP